MLEPHMLTHIEQLANYLTSSIRSTQEISRYLVENTLRSFGIVHCFFWRVDADKKMRFVSGHSKEAPSSEDFQPINLESKLPVTDCIKSGEIIWISNRDQLYKNYSEMDKYPLPAKYKTFVSVPLKYEGYPIASWGLTCEENIDPNPILISYLNTVSGMAGLYAKDLPEFKSARKDGVSRRVLSRRQNNILNLVKEKLTNQEIGVELGFSESTIRQETMKIYKILNVKNRREAAAFKFLED